MLLYALTATAGQHVPGVMDPIAESERCSCTPKVEKEGKEYDSYSEHVLTIC